MTTTAPTYRLAHTDTKALNGTEIRVYVAAEPDPTLYLPLYFPKFIQREAVQIAAWYADADPHGLGSYEVTLRANNRHWLVTLTRRQARVRSDVNGVSYRVAWYEDDDSWNTGEPYLRVEVAP